MEWEKKKEGKENEKCSTMPDVLIKGYKILKTVSVGQDFSVRNLSISSRVYPTAYAGRIV